MGVAQNAKKVLSFKDVITDVYHNIAPACQTYVLQTDDGVKEYKTKTYMIGNLNDAKSQSKKQKNLKKKVNIFCILMIMSMILMIHIQQRLKMILMIIILIIMMMMQLMMKI